MNTLSFSTIFRANVASVFHFHDDPGNLSRITPERTRVTIEQFDPPGAGSRVVLFVYPLPFIRIRLSMRFTRYEPCTVLEDSQESGPFAYWRHTRTFSESGTATVLTEQIQYSLPFGLLGRIADRLFVRKQIVSMFAARHQAMQTLLRGSM